MEFNEKEIKRLIIILAIILLGVLVFILIKPVLLSIIGGLILAYIFSPIHKRIKKLVKNDNIAAILSSIIILAIIIIPLWFLLPGVISQVFSFFQLTQGFDIQGLVSTIFPSASEEFIAQVTITFNNLASKLTSSILNSLIDTLIDFTAVMLHLFIVAFVFFFTLRDYKKLKSFIEEVSPLNRNQERIIAKSFSDITDSIVFGQIVIGILQGVVAGVGLLIFGVPSALLLSVLSIILAVIPIIGPAFVWIPVTLYLFAMGSPVLAIGFLIYNLLITSSIDNFLRPYIVARKTNISTPIILVGMMGGIFVFGVLGLILGPLILAYFLTMIRAYKEKTLGSLFQH